MPAAVAVPLIVGAASTGASVAGAKMASNSAKKAADMQSASASDALNLTRDMHAQTRGDLMPYMQAGTSALPGLSLQLQRERPSFGAPRVPPFSAAQMAPAAGGQPTPGMSGEMITLEAPDGSRRTLPREAANALTAKFGAMKVIR